MGKAEKGVNKEQSGEKELKQGETRKERLQEQQQKHSTLCRNSVVPFLGKQKKMAPNIKHKNTKIGPMWQVTKDSSHCLSILTQEKGSWHLRISSQWL